jgi:hypothetical protein
MMITTSLPQGAQQNKFLSLSMCVSFFVQGGGVAAGAAAFALPRDSQPQAQLPFRALAKCLPMQNVIRDRNGDK